MEGLRESRKEVCQLERKTYNFSHEIPPKRKGNKNTIEKKKNILKSKKPLSNIQLSQQSQISLPNICRGAFLRIFTRIMHVHLTNIADPGSYNKTLNEIFKNNFPEIKMPDNRPSTKILILFQRQEEELMEEDTDVDVEEVSHAEGDRGGPKD